MIALQAIRFGFGGADIFDAFSLSFEPGTTTAILGPSGSGKTTIVRLLCGLLTPSSGDVLVDGQPLTAAGRVRGLLFQDDTLVPWLDVCANAVFPRELDATLRREAETRLAGVGLAHALERLPHELSSGMKKRLEFVRATMADDAYLVADEPFTGLDLHQRQLLWDQWRAWIRGTRRTGIIVTHNPVEVSAIADRIVVISAETPSRIVLNSPVDAGSDSAIADALRAIAPEAALP